MKRLLFLSVCTLFGLTVAAQEQQIKMPNFVVLQKSVEKSNADTANPKKMNNPKTWVSRGQMFMDVYDKSTLGATRGMPTAFFAMLKAEKKRVKVGEDTCQTLVLPNIELYFNQNGLLICWKETKTVVDDALSQSLASFQRAIELDVKGSSSKSIKQNLEQLAMKNRIEGENAYTLQDYKAAQKRFMESVQASTNPLVGKLDSIIAYYAGLMSLSDDVKDYDNAITYLKICVDNNYFEGGDVYLRLAKAYEGKGDRSSQEKMLVDGFMKFPKNQSILIELINMYLTAGDDATKVLPFLHQAQENEPTNGTLFFAEATLYERLAAADSLNRSRYMGDAERLYRKSIEVSPDNYNAYYNLGALYYNKGVEYVKQSSAIKDWKDHKIKELEDLANVEFRHALEPFIRAHELQPSDKSSLETIKNICFRFRNESKEMMDKYNEYNEKLKQIAQ